MEKETKNIVRVAEGKFPFSFRIEKAIPKEEEGRMVVEGVASTMNVDHDKERMSVGALKSMANIINTSGVPLRVEHSQKDNAVIGMVNKAWIDERNQLWIKAILDENHPAAGILYKGLKEGVKMGLSVGGYVKRAAQEMVEGVGKMVNTFYDVLLDEVSVTQKPSNYDARLMAKSFAKSKGGVDVLAELFEGSEFMFMSAQGDYLQAFSKSIPENEWKQVDKNYKLSEKNVMDDKDKKGDEKTEKAVTRAEFDALTKMVAEGFNGLTAGIVKMAKAMEVGAKDNEMPDKEKVDPEKGKTVKASGGDAKDGEQPDKQKKDPEMGKAREGQEDSEGNGDDNKGEREKTAKAEGKEDDKDEKKDKTAKAKDETYDLETVERAIKTIQDFNKAADEKDEKKDDKKEKAMDDSESDEKKDKSIKKSVGVSAIDRFVIEVATAIERMEKSMKDGGFQTEHIAKSIIQSIRDNPDHQKDIAAMLTEPGAKRSVINGTPFVKMKDGRTYKLVLNDIGRVEKSGEDKPKNFKEAWGRDFSSVKQTE